MTEINNLKNDDGTYPTDTFQQINNAYFNFVAFDGHSVAADHCLLHSMHDGRKKPYDISPQHFLTLFQT